MSFMKDIKKGLNAHERSGVPVPKVQNRERSLPAALLMLIRNMVLPDTAGYESRPLKVLAASAIRGTCESSMQLLADQLTSRIIALLGSHLQKFWVGEQATEGWSKSQCEAPAMAAAPRPERIHLP